MVNDNYFDKSIAEKFAEALRKSQIRNLVFINTALGLDLVGDNYSEFVSYMRPIKQLVYQS